MQLSEQAEHMTPPQPTNPPQNTILRTLIDRTSIGEAKQPAYKYITNSTIIQHQGVPSQAGAPAAAGRRGMHSAVCAFWNTEKDGTFSFKWEGAERRGLDVVINIHWISI